MKKVHRFIPVSACIEKIQATASNREADRFYDSYFDSSTFHLARKNISLRSRNGIFILKIPTGPNTYQYIDYEQEIVKQLDSVSYLPLKNILKKQGIDKKFSFTTERKVYTLETVSVMIDRVYSLGSELFEYHLAKVVGDVSATTQFCEAHQLPLEEALPKSVFFLKTFYPDVFRS